MLTQETLRFVRDVVAPQRVPLLSLYLDVDPTNPDNSGGSPLLRARQATTALGLDKRFVETVLTRLRAELRPLRARTLVLFAADPVDELWSLHGLQLALPLGPRGVLAQWGVPATLPLLRAIDAADRYGVVLVDAARWRYFEIFLDEIDERHDAFRPLDPSGWRRLDEAYVATPTGVPARGGSGKDHVDRRRRVWSERFHRQAAERLEREMVDRGVERLLLLGPDREVHAFEAALPERLRDRVAGCLAAPVTADPAAVMTRVAPLLDHDRRLRALAFVDTLLERGVLGLEATLDALQAGALDTVAISAAADPTVYRCEASERLVVSLAALQRWCPDEAHRLTGLQPLLPEVAIRYGTALRYLDGDAGRRLERHAGGVAGLRRFDPEPPR